MKREFQGKQFESVHVSTLKSGQELPYDLYVFLPLNVRMVKIRARGQALDSAAISSYTSRGHENFYVLAGSAANGLAEPSQPIAIPGESAISSKEYTVENAKKDQDSFSGEILSGKDKAEEDFSSISKSAKSESELNLGAADSPEQDELKLAAPESEPEESMAAEEAAVPEKGGRAKRLEEEARQQFEAAIKKENKKKRELGAEEELVETDQGFAAAEDEVEQAFNAEVAEKEALALVRGKAEKPDLSSTKISSEINGIEEKLQTFSADAKEFVEEVRRIEADEQKEGEDTWNLTLSEDSPKLRGLSREDRAGAKLAFSLGKKLGQLRAELNDNLGASPKGEEEAAALGARQKELSEHIKKLEVTSMILESLDDKDIQVEALPEELASKSKLELLTHLEKNISELSGSALLDEEGARSIGKKIKKVKAMDFGVHAEKVDELSESLARRRARLIEEGLKMDAAARAEVNSEVAKEVKSARIGAQATKQLSEKRRELSKLLDETPKNDGETKANEKKARAIQEKILALESISLAAEAGESLAESELKGFELETNPDFELKEGENEAEAMVRIQDKLQSLKAEVVDAKQDAADAQQALMAKINGVEPEPVQNPERAPENSTVERLEKLGQLRAELLKFDAQKFGGTELDEEALEELHGKAAKAVAEADALQKIDSKLSVMRDALRAILKENASSPEQKAKIEAMALKANAEIRELEVLQSAIENGTEIPAGRLAPYLARKGSELAVREPGESASAALQRLSGLLQSATESVDESKKRTEATEKHLREEISAGDFTALKIKNINTKNIEGDEKKLSRLLKTFLETGKAIDPKEIWEVKKSMAAHAKLAAAGIGVAKKISALGDQLKELSQESGGGLKAEEARKSKINELHSEIFQLKKLGDSIDSGNDVDSKRIAPYVGAEEETFVFKGESPSPEEITQVIKSLGALKDEVIKFRADSLETVDDVMVLKRLGAEKGADDKLKRLVSGKDGKNVQAGVYAAAFFRSFGYDAPELELDLILAAYLGEVSAEQVATSFPGRVAAFHGAQESGQKEMFLYDLGQAIRLARSYLDIPEAGTGKVSLDPKILAEFSKNTPRDAVDFQLLERARQGAEVPMPVPERERLVGLAESARQLIAKANLPVKVRGA